ncbi:claudin-5 [Sphaerodactylus townsendi]|uniref:Claudin-5 n=1 Tax=Sphaerodactylus townsendi TaxID=933632 RepID=A0ACB8FZ15_9SAUR|nr:claudin-5 [Sphaerodactylus townsendi]
MASAALELLGLALSILGWAGSILASGLPMWQVSAFVEANIVTAQITWEGLWMACVALSTGHTQCKVYDSILSLPAELQAGRTLMVLAALLGLVALLVTVVGAQCTTCVRAGKLKVWIAAVGGGLFALCGLLVLIPPSWFARIIIGNFYDPASRSKREMGAALYVAWASSALLLLGGALICCPCARKDDSAAAAFPVKYAAPRRPTSTANANGEYDKKNYV